MSAGKVSPRIECQLHKVTDTELLYFADVLKVPVAALYPPVNGNGHLRESLEKLLEREKKTKSAKLFR